MAARGERGVSRVLDKLKASIDSGQYYEAHQMYRTLYFRYLSQKKFAELLKLLCEGSSLLLDKDQQGSGADLAILVIDVLSKSETSPNEEWIDEIGKLFEKMHSSLPERDMFLTNAIKWSMGNGKKGHPLLHKKIANIYWKEQKYPTAHKHFWHSSDGIGYAKLLIESHTTRGNKSEIDLFIAQAVLVLLCVKNLSTAKETFNYYVREHPRIKNTEGPPYPYPLLDFLHLLLQAVEQKNKEQFEQLRKKYSECLKCDANYTNYLDTIGRKWFGIQLPPDPRNPNSVFGGLLKSIMGDPAESSDEDIEFSAHTAIAPDLD